MIESPSPTGTSLPVRARWSLTYRGISLAFSAVFAAVGLLFLLVPGTVLAFFNDLSIAVGLQSSSVEGPGFTLILAVGYMYVVSAIAWLMWRYPENLIFPILLVNAKLASSLLSFIFFFAVRHALIYLANGIVDGLIGAGVFWMYRKQRRAL